ncbi:MAG TPA: M48 family metallopeptidase [Pyrinomonadaceae bacterium]|nr:M48 family metallopeptidase [Acidobacteriota bacterium]HQZ96318.1 M48 family metallopeptidase [Pyrinomonadaceae bacterium]
MANDPQNLPVCSNGHRQPAHGSRFCIYCGTGMAVQAPQPQQPQNQQWQQPQAHQAQLQPPNYDQNYQPQPQFVPQPAICRTCGGDGRGLSEKSVVCKECRWLRPLVPGYQIDNSAFAWAADAKAMAALKAAKPLNAAAKAVSEKVGRRWIEVSFNGILLGEKQMPQVFGQAVRAARILGMSHMPDIYLSGDRPWDCLTFGSDKNSFIVIGSAVAGNFQGVDMLYLLAREMGHCKAGHALWKTVIRFFLGEQGPAKGFMAGGIFNAILSPSALIGGAVEMPLLAWARQAEITADRAGLLAVGSEEVARRTLLSWSLKSSFIFKQINIEAWLEQQREDDGDLLRLSELTTTSTPYLGPRLKLLNQFANGPEFARTASWIKQALMKNAPPKPAPVPPPPKPKAPTEIKIKCSACKAPLRVPISALKGKQKLSVKCPSAGCGKVTDIQKRIKPAEPKAPPAKIKEENQNYGE